MDVPLQRKPRLYFDTVEGAANVSFDDGKECRMFPWSRCVEARWCAAEPETIKIEIGGWVVVICGNNLVPVRQAIELQTLLRIRANAELESEGEHRIDSFASMIRFIRAPKPHAAGKSESQGELPLPE